MREVKRIATLDGYSVTLAIDDDDRQIVAVHDLNGCLVGQGEYSTIDDAARKASQWIERSVGGQVSHHCIDCGDAFYLFGNLVSRRCDACQWAAAESRGELD